MSDPASLTLITLLDLPGPGLFEWVAHHRAMGITRLMVLDPGRDVLASKMAQDLASVGLRVIPVAATPDRLVLRAMRLAARDPTYQEADWAMVLPVSQLLVSHDLGPALAGLGNADIARLAGEMRAHDGALHLSNTPASLRFGHVGGAIADGLIFRVAEFSRPGLDGPRGPKRPPESLLEICATDLSLHQQAQDAAAFLLAQAARSASPDAASPAWRAAQPDPVRAADPRMGAAMLAEMDRLDAACDGALWSGWAQGCGLRREAFEMLMEDGQWRDAYHSCFRDD